MKIDGRKNGGYGDSGLWTELMLVCGDQGRVCDGSRTG